MFTDIVNILHIGYSCCIRVYAHEASAIYDIYVCVCVCVCMYSICVEYMYDMVCEDSGYTLCDTHTHTHTRHPYTYTHIHTHTHTLCDTYMCVCVCVCVCTCMTVCIDIVYAPCDTHRYVYVGSCVSPCDTHRYERTKQGRRYRRPLVSCKERYVY